MIIIGKHNRVEGKEISVDQRKISLNRKDRNVDEQSELLVRTDYWLTRKR